MCIYEHKPHHRIVKMNHEKAIRQVTCNFCNIPWQCIKLKPKVMPIENNLVLVTIHV